MVVKQVPAPTNSTPIATTVIIDVTMQGIDPKQWKVEYTIMSAINYQMVDHNYVGFTKIDSDTIEAEIKVPGDERYYIDVKVLWEGDVQSWLTLKNFKGKA